MYICIYFLHKHKFSLFRYCKWTLIFDSCFLGPCKEFSPPETVFKQLNNYNIIRTFRLKWKSIAYVGKDNSHSSKTSNFVSIVNTYGANILVVLRYFIHVENKNMLFFVGHKIERCKIWSLLHTYYNCSQIMGIWEDKLVFQLEDLLMP